MKLLIDTVDLEEFVYSVCEYIEDNGFELLTIYPERDAGYLGETDIIKTIIMSLVREQYGLNDEPIYLRLESAYNLSPIKRHAHKDAMRRLILPRYRTKPSDVSMAGTKLIIIWEV